MPADLDGRCVHCSHRFSTKFRSNPDATTTHLDGKHTVFGRVIDGMEVLAHLQRIDPRQPGPEPDRILKATVLRKRNHSYVVTKKPARRN